MPGGRGGIPPMAVFLLYFFCTFLETYINDEEREEMGLLALYFWPKSDFGFSDFFKLENLDIAI